MSDHRVILADCLGPEGLATLPDKSVDHVIADPPFASEIYERGAVTNHETSRSGSSPGQILMKAGSIGSLEFVLDGFIREAARVARRWVVVFIDVESVGTVKGKMMCAPRGLRYVRTGAWVKTDPMPQFSGDRPAQGFEAVCIAHSSDHIGKMRWNGGGRAALWTFGVCKENRPAHPCPKPLPLMESVISDFTDPGEMICDPFAGSGTTGVACKRLGRRFIGWERDPKYHAIAAKRIDGAREQLNLLRERGPKPVQASLLPAASLTGEG